MFYFSSSSFTHFSMISSSVSRLKFLLSKRMPVELYVTKPTGHSSVLILSCSTSGVWPSLKHLLSWLPYHPPLVFLPSAVLSPVSMFLLLYLSIKYGSAWPCLRSSSFSPFTLFSCDLIHSLSISILMTPKVTLSA